MTTSRPAGVARSQYGRHLTDDATRLGGDDRPSRRPVAVSSVVSGMRPRSRRLAPRPRKRSPPSPARRRTRRHRAFSAIVSTDRSACEQSYIILRTDARRISDVHTSPRPSKRASDGEDPTSRDTRTDRRRL